MFSINDTISEDMSKSGVSAVSESNATARSGDTEERKTTGFWGCERCAGIFMFMAFGMIYFSVLAGRMFAAATTCPLGFIVSVIAYVRSRKENRVVVSILSGAAILFFLIYACSIQSNVNSHLRPYATW